MHFDCLHFERFHFYPILCNNIMAVLTWHCFDGSVGTCVGSQHVHQCEACILHMQTHADGTMKNAGAMHVREMVPAGVMHVRKLVSCWCHAYQKKVVRRLIRVPICSRYALLCVAFKQGRVAGMKHHCDEQDEKHLIRVCHRCRETHISTARFALSHFLWPLYPHWAKCSHL